MNDLDVDVDQLVGQLHAHQPTADGYCPACGVKACEPRRTARERLFAAGVDLTQPSPLAEGLLEIYRAEYLAHRDCDPPCVDVKQAVEHLIASGVDPATVTA